jgi:hypothetical protein
VNVQTHDPIIENVLDAHREALGSDLPALRNHIYRSLNYQRLLLGVEKLPDAAVLAWAVHDLGIWTARTFDYLAPSADLARAFATESTDLAATESMVLRHHRIRPVADPLTESFRRADLIDVSRGLLPARVGRRAVREIVAEFPYEGFHRFLARGLTTYAIRNPLRPFPMLRW